MELLNNVDTIIYGRLTYEMMAGFWPSAPGEFAERTNKIQKLVCSKTLTETPWGDWNNARPINGEIIEKYQRSNNSPAWIWLYTAAAALCVN